MSWKESFEIGPDQNASLYHCFLGKLNPFWRYVLLTAALRVPRHCDRSDGEWFSQGKSADGPLAEMREPERPGYQDPLEAGGSHQEGAVQYTPSP